MEICNQLNILYIFLRRHALKPLALASSGRLRYILLSLLSRMRCFLTLEILLQKTYFLSLLLKTQILVLGPSLELAIRQLQLSIIHKLYNYSPQSFTYQYPPWEGGF
jgi:hypothetical protein